MGYKDPEMKRIKAKEYREKNKEKLKAYFKAKYEENRDERLAYKREHYQKTKDVQLAKSKEYHASHKEERKARDEKNRDHIRERDREYHAKRMETDDNYRIRRTLRSRMHNALRGNAKAGSTLELLGCSIEDFKKHIEDQFAEGMSWDNHSHTGWHVDHIKPCDAFDLTDPEEQKKCFNYKNLQPLWAYDNLSKGDRYE